MLITPWLFVAVFWLFSYFPGVWSVKQFHTYDGCNATLVCYYSFGASANWTTSLGPLQQGPKVIITDANHYSVLTLISVTTADNGNISCFSNQSETLEFSLSVQEECKDIFNTVTCQATVAGGDDCTNPWMRKECQKSCGLCPQYNCTESEKPTVPAPTHTTTVVMPLVSTKATAINTVASGNSSSRVISPNLLRQLAMFLLPIILFKHFK